MKRGHEEANRVPGFELTKKRGFDRDETPPPNLR